MMILILIIILPFLLATSAQDNVPELHVKHRQFADDMVQQLWKEENECSSSLSVSMAFALLYPAMIGDTKIETENLFGFPTNNNQIVWDDAENDLETQYSGQCSDIPDCMNKDAFVSIANSIWIDTNESINPNYGSIINDILYETSFQADGGSIPINTWVNETTNGLIKDIITDEKLKQLVLLAVNAIYLKAAWASPFEINKNTLDKFYTSPARSEIVNENVLFMHQVEYFMYTEVDNYQVVKLPLYGTNSGLSMLFVLPKNDNTDLLSSTKLISDAIPSLERKFVALALPKFKHSSTYNDLTPTLQSLGLDSPFDPTKNELCVLDHEICDQFISLVIQKTVIAIDEEGVEAAAVTAIGVGVTSSPQYPKAKVFMADRPFQFFIYDSKTELVLFEGLVGNPESPEGGDVPTLTNKHDSEYFWNEVFGVAVEGQETGGVLGIMWSMIQGIIDWLLSIVRNFFGVQ